MGTPIRLPDTGDGLRILVCRTDALGDVILSTPVFRALRSELPNAHITALCREYTAPVLMGNPSIDEVITTPDESRASCDSLIRSLKTNSQGPPFDIAIVLYPSEFAVTLVYKLRIPLRVGTAGRWRSWKFTHRMRHSRKQNRKSEASYNLDLLEPLGMQPSSFRPEIFFTDRDKQSAQSLLGKYSIGERFVILHPGSGGSALDWSIERFCELATLLSESGTCDVLFTGSEDEGRKIESGCGELFQNSGGGFKAVSVAGETDIPTLAALSSLSRVLVANSTGPLHLAAAVGTPTIGVFPPSRSMSPIRWAPPVDNTVILTPERPPCACRNVCRKGACMDSISANEVKSVLESVFAGSATSNV